VTKTADSAPKTADRVTKTATPWGPATVVERVTLLQRVGAKRFASLIELLESDRGDRLVRFAYATGGTLRRGPVTLRAQDLERLHSRLARTPALAAALRAGIETEHGGGGA
jgi:hypothetical protein